MRKLLFLLVSLVTTSAIAQTTVYKVSKGERVIYLGGTVHILREADYPLPKEFEQAYQDSDILTFETDTKSLNDPSVAQKMMKEGMFQNDQTLKTVLADSNYVALQVAFEKAGLPFAMMQKMKPALAVTTLSAMSMKSAGMTAEGVDMYFTNKAIVDKKEMQQLESVEDQIFKITGMADGKEDEFVSYSLKGMDEMEGELNELIDNWKTGATDKMLEEIETMKMEYPEMYKSMLVDRNNNWMPKILSYLENGTKAFVLVGSLHLHGSDGLINLLATQGFKVEQL